MLAAVIRFLDTTKGGAGNTHDFATGAPRVWRGAQLREQRWLRSPGSLFALCLILIAHTYAGGLPAQIKISPKGKTCARSVGEQRHETTLLHVQLKKSTTRYPRYIRLSIPEIKAGRTCWRKGRAGRPSAAPGAPSRAGRP